MVSLAEDGTGPGVWFLQLSNIVGAGANRPDTVFVFFHDDLITRPVGFTGPEDDSLVERLSHMTSDELNTESIFKDITDDVSLRDRLSNGFTAVYPITRSASSGQNLVSSGGALVAWSNRDEASERSEEFFSFANRRSRFRIHS